MRARLVGAGALAAGALALAACASNGVSGPAPGLEHATATRSCAPADGPAVSIYLAGSASAGVPPVRPYVLVSIEGSRDQLAGRTYRVAGSSRWVGASKVGAGDYAIESATDGSVTVRAVRADGTIEGAVDLAFPSGPVRGDFRAAWFERQALCG